MRLWHESLLPYLPRQQLLGQHRECCALRGNGWGKPHATVNYVFRHPLEWLWAYHIKVMGEMFRRGYAPDPKWLDPGYRGTLHELEKSLPEFDNGLKRAFSDTMVYPEHDDKYLWECIENLKRKGAEIHFG